MLTANEPHSVSAGDAVVGAAVRGKSLSIVALAAAIETDEFDAEVIESLGSP